MTSTLPAPRPDDVDPASDPFFAAAFPGSQTMPQFDHETARLRRRLFIARCHAVIWRCATEANLWSSVGELARQLERASLVKRCERRCARWSARLEHVRQILVRSGAADVVIVGPIFSPGGGLKS